ncbi:Hsp20 family protein [Palleronia caenipelagi]|uniref:Hsp20 family protein n=1 Tax=Palleronia caenipelagi TaxID=2489174 RepID=A0A547Q2I7_9RHOB|nr:Hsp20 family protein [Palleronia caenipelagi]TRD20603.1 Hsp20 family protein [Palleronia caenipelagi]
MRTYDLAPLYRATVGFDQMADLMDRVMRDTRSGESYPPYNIEKTADDAWSIEIAVAGFGEADLSVEQREKALIVTGKKAADDAKRNYLHRGIATRAFERRFHLADHVRVEAARHRDGMLVIELRREVPDALKPRQIAIASDRAGAIEAEISA